MNKLAALIIILSAAAFSQSRWFPEGLNIQPFTANFLEPKAGFSFALNRSDIRLDIGTSADFYKYVSGNKTFSAGGDLFTYTRLHGTEEFHFPVEAIDYLFGLNAGYKSVESSYEYGARFRFSHISAHFVDGHFDHSTNYWIDNKAPRVYSREFLELFPYIKFNGLRLYLGLTYLIHVTPPEIGKSILQTGFDYFYLNDLFPFTPFIAYDFKLAKISEYEGNHILCTGIKFGHPEGKGFSILLSYFSGRSIHGEYFDIKEEYSTIGFNIDL